MSLLKQLDQDLKLALKDRDSMRVSVLRLLKSSLSYRKIDKGEDLTNEEIISVIEKEAKTRRESIAAYTGKRDDLAQKEQQELAIIEKYLPEGLSEKEISLIIDQVIDSVDQDKPFGQTMGMVMGKLKGQRVDGNQVKQLLQQKLNN